MTLEPIRFNSAEAVEDRLRDLLAAARGRPIEQADPIGPALMVGLYLDNIEIVRKLFFRLVKQNFGYRISPKIDVRTTFHQLAETIHARTAARPD